MRIRRPCMLFAALALVLGLARASALAAGPESGRIDWTGLRAVGYAAPNAPARQAALLARKNLLATLRGVPLTAELTAGQRLQRDARAADRLRVLALASPMQTGPAAETGREALQAVLPLAGEVLELLLPPAAQFNTGLAPRLAPRPEAQRGELPAVSLERVEQGLLELRARPPLGAKPLESFRQPAALPAQAPELPDTEHTGLVVDARGLGASPALLPVLFDEAGAGLYGAFLVPRNSVVRQGLVVYAPDMDAAGLRLRVGDAPLVVQAAGLAREAGPDLRLAAPEAQAVRALLRSRAVLARCAVAILLD